MLLAGTFHTENAPVVQVVFCKFPSAVDKTAFACLTTINRCARLSGPKAKNFFNNSPSNSSMNPHIHVGGGWLVLLLALTAPGGAAPESAVPDGAVPPPAPTSVVAPAPTTAVETPAPTARPKVSPEIASQITSAIPVWIPPPPKPVDKPRQPPPPSDPEVVEMAPMIVQGNRLPRTEKMDWLTPHPKDVELVKTYITPFDRYFLNRFTLPLFGISKEERARMMYEEDKRLSDMKWINEQIDEIKLLDPAEAKTLLSVRNSTFDRKEP
jgi:hypothetical protein